MSKVDQTHKIKSFDESVSSSTSEGCQPDGRAIDGNETCTSELKARLEKIIARDEDEATKHRSFNPGQLTPHEAAIKAQQGLEDMGFNPRADPPPIRGDVVSRVAGHLNSELEKRTSEFLLTGDEVHAAIGILNGFVCALITGNYVRDELWEELKRENVTRNLNFKKGQNNVAANLNDVDCDSGFGSAGGVG